MSRIPEGSISFTPDYAVPPGRTLKETLETLGMDQRELAVRTGLTRKTINQIIQGKHPLSQSTALKLERVTGVPARVWNNLEMVFQERNARTKDRERLEKDLDWLDLIPVTELVRREAVPKTREKVARLSEVLKFFGVNAVSEWEDLWVGNPVCRIGGSDSPNPNLGAMAAWLRLGEIEAMRMDSSPFDRARFLSMMKWMPKAGLQASQPRNWTGEWIGMCAKSGVALVLVPPMPGCSLNCVARWLNPRKAMIQIDPELLNQNRFSSTFINACAHLLHGRKKELYFESHFHSSSPESKGLRRGAPPPSVR